MTNTLLQIYEISSSVPHFAFPIPPMHIRMAAHLSTVTGGWNNYYKQTKLNFCYFIF